MKISLTVIIACVGMLVACRSTVPSTTSTDQASDVLIVGGYSLVDVRDSAVVACAQYAVQQQQPAGSVRLVSIESAQRQVVAGTNTKITMIVNRGGQMEHAYATVWSKLDGTMELTSWEAHQH